MKKRLSLLLTAIMAVGLVSYQPEVVSAKTDTFEIGETWNADDIFTITVVGVTELEERNEFSDKEPAAVYVVDYVYENLSYDDDILGGFYPLMGDTIVDAEGDLGYSYPGDYDYYPSFAPAGTTCFAQVCIGVDNAGPFTLHVSEYDSDYNQHKAQFHIDPSAEPIEYEIPAGSYAPENALAIGETWVVDDQWELTMTGVEKVEANNSYSNLDPEVCYQVSYSYKNLGYESDIFDGLYMNIEDTVIDSSSQLGYSYPNYSDEYPQETPIGAKCKASCTFGLEHEGNFYILVSQYDGNDELQTQAFYIEVE